MKRSVLLLGALALILVSCGGDDEGTSAGDNGGPSLSIAEPSDGAEVELPLTVRFTSDSELGPADSGASHVHLWLDGNEEDYEVIEGDEFKIRDLSPGEHTIDVSLRNANHSAAGAQDEITITVTGDG